MGTDLKSSCCGAPIGTGYTDGLNRCQLCGCPCNPAAPESKTMTIEKACEHAMAMGRLADEKRKKSRQQDADEATCHECDYKDKRIRKLTDGLMAARIYATSIKKHYPFFTRRGCKYLIDMVDSILPPQ